MYLVNIGNKIYSISKSSRKYKKYDVYLDSKFITSFGDKRYQHYKDRFGYYSNLDHHDIKRRNNYRKRSEGIGNLKNPYSGNFWAYHFLW